MKDEGRSLEIGLQDLVSNRLKLLWSKAKVVCVEGKGVTRSRQVRIKKANVNELLMKCRNRRDDVKTGVRSITRDKSKGNLFTGWVASGMEVARA